MPPAVKYRYLTRPEHPDRTDRTAGDVRQIQCEITDDLAAGDSSNSQVVGAQSQRWRPHDNREKDRREKTAESRQQKRHLEAHHQDRHSVRSNRHEGDVSEVRQAGERVLDIETKRHNAIDPGDDGNE